MGLGESLWVCDAVPGGWKWVTRTRKGNRSSSGCPVRFFFPFWLLVQEDTGELQGKEFPCCVLVCGSWFPGQSTLLPVSEGNRGKARKEKQRPGGEAVQEPNGLLHPEMDPIPANLYAPWGARSTCTLTIVLRCTHHIAFTRMLTLQVCHINASTHTRQPTGDTSLPMTPHKCTDAFSEEQIRTHTRCSPRSTALGCTHVHIHVPCIDTWSPLLTAGTCKTPTHRCSPEATHSCTHDTTLSPFSIILCRWTPS